MVGHRRRRSRFRVFLAGMVGGGVEGGWCGTRGGRRPAGCYRFISFRSIFFVFLLFFVVVGASFCRCLFCFAEWRYSSCSNNKKVGVGGAGYLVVLA